MVQPVIILDNIRSAANVGSILRTADAAGVVRVILCGITPYPRQPNDSRDPAILGRIERAIAKTALGAERSVATEYIANTASAIDRYRTEGRTIYGLEQAPEAVDLFAVKPATSWVLVIGNEVEGVAPPTLHLCDQVIEIPQQGHKESLNVAVATGIAIYQLCRQRLSQSSQ